MYRIVNTHSCPCEQGLQYLRFCVNMSVCSKSIYNMVEFITPKNLSYLQYIIFYIINIGIFSKMCNAVDLRPYLCLLLYRLTC